MAIRNGRGGFEALFHRLQRVACDGNSADANERLDEIEQTKLDKQYDAGDLSAEFRKLATIRSAVWLAFGEIIHAAQCVERSRPANDRLP